MATWAVAGACRPRAPLRQLASLEVRTRVRVARLCLLQDAFGAATSVARQQLQGPAAVGLASAAWLIARLPRAPRRHHAVRLPDIGADFHLLGRAGWERVRGNVARAVRLPHVSLAEAVARTVAVAAVPGRPLAKHEGPVAARSSLAALHLPKTALARLAPKLRWLSNVPHPILPANAACGAAACPRTPCRETASYRDPFLRLEKSMTTASTTSTLALALAPRPHDLAAVAHPVCSHRPGCC